MTYRPVSQALVAAVLALCVTAVQSAHVLVDLTDNNLYAGNQLKDPFTVGGLDFDVVSSGTVKRTGGAPSGEPFCLSSAGGFLACDTDGAGIRDDELTANLGANIGDGEWIRFDIMSATPVSLRLVEIYALDLFTENVDTPSKQQKESVVVTVDGNSAGAQEFFAYTPLPGIGFGEFSLDTLVASSIRFDPGLGKDDGSGDFALAGFKLEVTPVPLPAAAWLFASALIGAGVIGRRKTQA